MSVNHALHDLQEAPENIKDSFSKAIAENFKKLFNIELIFSDKANPYTAEIKGDINKGSSASCKVIVGK